MPPPSAPTCWGAATQGDQPLAHGGSQQPGQGQTLVKCEKETDPSLFFPQRILSSPPTNSLLPLLWALWGSLFHLERALCAVPAAPVGSDLLLSCVEGANT